MKAPAYARYRTSGFEWLGEIPEHWEAKRARFCMAVNPRAGRIRQLGPDDGISFVPMEAIHEYGGLDLSRSCLVGDVGSGYTEFQDGDVIVAKITPCFENGKGALAMGLLNGAALGTTELHVLRARDGLDRRYLLYLTLSQGYRELGEAEMYGAGGQKRVPPDFAEDFPTPVPPLGEQHAIASFLDRETAKLDALVAKKRDLIEKVKEKRRALISQAVTRGLPPDAARAAGLDPYPTLRLSGVTWLGDLPQHWQLLQLRRVVGRFVDYRGRTPAKSDDGVPLITAGAIRDGVIDHALAPEYIAEEDYSEWMGRGLPERGDVVITTEAPLAEVAQVEDTRAAFAQRVILLKVNRRRMLPEFLRYYYLSGGGRSELLSRGTGSTAVGIRADRLRMSLVVTPPLREQEQIVRYLDAKTAALVAPIPSVEAAIERLQEYRAALITAAVTGKIDVREALA